MARSKAPIVVEKLPTLRVPGFECVFGITLGLHDTVGNS